MTTLEGFKWMGVMIIAVTATLVFIHFPMWGGMLTRGSSKVTEEEYYRCVLPWRTAHLYCPGALPGVLHRGPPVYACSLTLAPSCHPTLPFAAAAATTLRLSGSRACTAPSSTGPASPAPTAASRSSWPSWMWRPRPPPPLLSKRARPHTFLPQTHPPSPSRPPARFVRIRYSPLPITSCFFHSGEWEPPPRLPHRPLALHSHCCAGA
jgi:hypothetical protein